MLAGTTWEDAADQLEQLSLVPTEVEEANDTVEAGQVIRTDPPPAEEVVTVGTPVTVYVSTGREPVAVPALANLSVDDAKAKLVEAGLTPGVENRVDSANAPAETILSTSPEAGTSVTVGSTVDLNISSGEVTLIDLTGQTLSAASDFLRASDVQLNPVPNPDTSCPSKPGSPIVRQSPRGGSVPQHSDVQLIYCAG